MPALQETMTVFCYNEEMQNEKMQNEKMQNEKMQKTKMSNEKMQNAVQYRMQKCRTKKCRIGGNAEMQKCRKCASKTALFCCPLFSD
jgi:hypothetical protein